MSTRKVKDGTIKSTTKAKKPTTTTKTRTTSKKNEDDKEENKKIRKPAVKPSTKIVSRPAPAKKVGSTSRPVTPPSSRITKTQFFPSKKMYALALNKKPVEAKKVADVSPDTSSMSERPRTATLRKGSIVNNNIVGPEVPKKINKAPVAIKVEEVPVEYEDDFDSYESDFEAYESSGSTTNISSGTTSSSETESTELSVAPKRVGSAGTDDEKKLDSGNYELPDSRHKQMLDNIKESIEKENANLGNEPRSNLGSLSDEGFEDGKSLQFINFLGAQKKYKHRKSIEMRRKRGEEILSMIRLDHYSFTLFDLAPVPYEIFIKNFGKSNTVQTSVQTGEDNLCEETQTEEIVCRNKWTQFPPYFDKIEDEENFWVTYKCNLLGVGGDSNDQRTENTVPRETGLEKFLLSTGNLVLNLLSEENIQISAQTDKSNVPFSRGCILYNTQAHDVLKNRPINDICFCSHNFSILTVHGRRKEDDIEESYVCLWNISNVDVPEMFLVVFGDVTSCVFSLDCSDLIFGGLSSGSLVVWDISENTNCHQNVSSDTNNGVVLRSPTYSTEVNYGHCCKIVSVQSLKSRASETYFFSSHTATEVCSLDEDGFVIIWSVIFKEESHGKTVEKQGLAHWGSVIITINVKISLKKLYPEIDDFRCTDICLSHLDSNNLYISTNYGIIVHCLASGGKTSVKKYFPDTQTQATCLEMCPFSPQYFLAGFDNGDISFYSRTVERPLMVMSNKEATEGRSEIQTIQWSYNRPLIFYTKDVTNTIHVWNLKVNDMFPIYSVPFRDKIMCVKLSPILTNDDDGAPEKTYMVIATDNGCVYVHLLGDEHDQQSAEDFDKDKRKFFSYINRCI